MRYFLTILVVFSVLPLLFAQKTIIVHRDTGEPFPGVLIESRSLKLQLLTDSLGYVEVGQFIGATDVRCTYLGFKPTQFTYQDLLSMQGRIEMIPDEFLLDQIVISATKWKQSSGNVPLKIITVSPKEIYLQNPQTAADVLGLSGKIFIQKSQQGGGSPMIRGFAANRLIYTVDGVRINNAIFRGGNIQNVINLDPFALENVEVVMGPGSVLYGSDAIGGVMSFKTIQPEFSTESQTLVKGKVNTRYSTANDEKTVHFDLGIGKKKWAFVSSFSYWDFGHLRQGSHGPVDYVKNIYPVRENDRDVVKLQNDPLLQIPTAYQQWNVMQKIQYKPVENVVMEYGFHRSQTSPYGRYDRHNRLRNGLLRYAEWDYGPQIWQMHQWNISHTGKNNFYDEATMRCAVQTFEESRIERNFNSHLRSTNMENVQAYSLNADFLKTINHKNTLSYGTELVINDVSSQGFITDISSDQTTKGPARYPVSSWNSLALYSLYSGQVTKQVKLQAGLRFNHNQLNASFNNNIDFYPFTFTNAELNHNAWSGSLGGVYRPSDRWILKVHVGSAFRAPNVDDIGKVFDSEPGAVTVPNPDLKAEIAYNAEVSVTHLMFDRIKWDITAYTTQLQNAMVRRNYKINGQDSIMYEGFLSQVQAIQNAASARVYGFEIGVEWKGPAGFTFLSDLNIQEGVEEMDSGEISPSRHAAPVFGVSRLKYQRKRVTLEIQMAYQGERKFEELAVEERSKTEIYASDSNGNSYAPAWCALHFKSITELHQGIQLGLGVENITDTRYRPYSSGLSGAGRNFVFSLKWNF